jgi:hypothetical protein
MLLLHKRPSTKASALPRPHLLGQARIRQLHLRLNFGHPDSPARQAAMATLGQLINRPAIASPSARTAAEKAVRTSASGVKAMKPAKRGEMKG